MMLDAALAYLHLMAILAWVVFLTSATALLRGEWFNAAALTRLAIVDRIALGAALAVLLSGLARTVWGAKGWAWYWGQPLLQTKVALLLLMVASGIGVSRRIAQWRRTFEAERRLPQADDLRALRRRLMWITHLMLVPPLLGVLLARGIATR